MEQDLDRQIISIQNDLNFLKSSLSPVFLFFQEIQEIKRRRHISQANSISNISILSLEIKEDVLRDVSAMQILTEEKIKNLHSDIKKLDDDNLHTINQVRDEICGVSLNTKDLFSNLNNLKNITGENTMYIKEIRKEMDFKATLQNIDEIRQIVKGMTPLSNYETLKSRVGECASVYQHNELHKKVQRLKLKVKSYVKTEEMDSKLKEYTMSLYKDFSLGYVTSGIYEAHHNRTEKMFSEANEHIISLKEYINKLDNANNDKMRLMKKTLESRPWKNELNPIYEELNLKIPRVELYEFTKETIESVKNFHKDLVKFENQVEMFDKIVERYDEILLEKAEKDEIRKINAIISGLASYETVDYIKKAMINFTKDSENKFQAQVAVVDNIKANFDFIQEKFDALKKDYFDVSNLSSSVMEFRQAIERKADKQDIYEIYDNMCKRVDFVEAYDILKILKKQVEQGTGLTFALCRTLVESGEPSMQIKRQRYELLKNFNNLMNWVIGESASCNSNLNTSRNPEPEIEDQGETRYTSRHSGFIRRRSAATARDTKRFHIDFPKVS